MCGLKKKLIGRENAPTTVQTVYHVQNFESNFLKPLQKY